MVTRPRSTPLLTPVETSRGRRYVWTTFSEDQIDLNYANPNVLVEMLDVLLLYIGRGARIIRLDAIAYLWKKIGTPSIHLPETHAVVKLMRDIVDAVAPGTILLTETNVPHKENVSYFGQGDEAHMVYNFSLAPLLLDAFLMEEAGPLNRWLADLDPPREGTTYLNFTASHDGVGVRPLEGLVDSDRLDRLIQSVRARGGLISTRRRADGSESPYELNITYFSALGPPADAPDSLSRELHVRRFLSSQAVMLALQGIAGVYFHSLVGTPNYTEGVAETGRARTINRRKFHRRELDEIVDAAGPSAPADAPPEIDNPPLPAQRMVFDRYRRLLDLRRRQPAFHPDAVQLWMDTGDSRVIAFCRKSLDGRQQIVVLCNVSGAAVRVTLSGDVEPGAMRDLLQTASIEGNSVTLPPYGTAWLT